MPLLVDEAHQIRSGFRLWAGRGEPDAPRVHSGHNFAGAEGPMQFLPAIFAQYATGPDRPLSIYDPADAISIYTAAKMLRRRRGRHRTGRLRLQPR